MPLSLQFQAAISSYGIRAPAGCSSTESSWAKWQRHRRCQSSSRCSMCSRVSAVTRCTVPSVLGVGPLRNAIWRGRKQKHVGVAQSANVDQSEGGPKEPTHSSKENSGPPLFTIIAGLFVLFVVIWALGSLLTWFIGLFIR